MAYRISYEDKVVVSAAPRIETFDTEKEALKRARELLDENSCQTVAVHDDAGEVLGGIRLQLKLGFTSD